MAQDLETAAKDIGSALSDAAQSEQVKKAQAQVGEKAAAAAQKVDSTLKDLSENESVKKAEESVQAAVQEIGKGLKGLGGFLKKKAEEVKKT